MLIRRFVVADTKLSPPGTTLDLRIEGMTCASCVGRVEKALKRVPGVLDASVNLATERASVRVLGGPDTVGSLIAAVDRTGYTAKEIRANDRPDRHDSAREAERVGLRRSLIAAAALTLPVVAIEMGAHLLPGIDAWIMAV